MRRASRAFGKRLVFADVDVEIPAGARLLVSGGNGAGKTTLLRCLAGTLTLSAGTAEIAGHPVGTLPARRLVGVCLAPERSLYEQLSVRDNLLLAARLRLPAPRRLVEVAAAERELGIAQVSSVPVHRCSTGTRARVAAARALLGDPLVLLLDEPTRALDDDGRTLLWAALQRRPGLTCVLASHDPADQERCDGTLNLPVRP